MLNQGSVVLRAERKTRGLSQKQLAELLGIERAYLSQLETGRRGPGRRVARKIQEVTGIGSELFDQPIEAVP